METSAKVADDKSVAAKPSGDATVDEAVEHAAPDGAKTDAASRPVTDGSDQRKQESPDQRTGVAVTVGSDTAADAAGNAPASTPPTDDSADDFASADEESGGGAPAWMVTFADMMSLLLCFFVLLLSFSVVDAEKFRQAAESLKEAFKFTVAPTPGQTPSTTLTNLKDQSVESTTTVYSQEDVFQERLQQAKRDIDEFIDRAGLSQHIQTEISSNYLEIVNSNPLNFPPGKAELLESSLQYLDALIPILKRPDFRIIVEGHTDSIPISTTLYRSNWELSAARAASFVTYLEEHGVDPKRMMVHGHGPYSPIAPNDTEENRARNRRIEIMLSSAEDQGDLAELLPDDVPVSEPEEGSESP
jgi:chemotaxis protein MotB